MSGVAYVLSASHCTNKNHILFKIRSNEVYEIEGDEAQAHGIFQTVDQRPVLELMHVDTTSIPGNVYKIFDEQLQISRI
jgi:hypothetical protein